MNNAGMLSLDKVFWSSNHFRALFFLKKKFIKFKIDNFDNK